MPPSTSQDRAWYTYLTFDLLLKICNNSIFHPFVCLCVPLCFRAVAFSYQSSEFRYSLAWAAFITVLETLSPINLRIAYGKSREVDLNEEVIVITGGASGLGRCLVEIYALRGATVAVIDVKSAKEEEVEGAYYYNCDIGDGEAVKKTWAKIKEDLGTPTILVNNAAIVHGKKFLDLTPEDVERSFNVNTLSHYRLNSLFLPPLLAKEDGGTLVTISSVLGHLGASHLSAYTASKAALIAYHTSLSAELSVSHPKIKTILVTPGQLSTDMFSGLEQGPVAHFLGPVTDVQLLAVKLMKMIDEGRGGRLAEPAYARWIPWLFIMPVGVQKIVRRLTGLDTAMLGFHGQGRDTTTLSKISSEKA